MSRTIPHMKSARFLFLAVLLWGSTGALASPYEWALAFPKTNFTRAVIDLSEIRATGAARDSIPAILAPKFQAAESITGMGELEPVLRIEIGGEVRGYPLRILLWHELVNDTIQGVPVLISYSPLSSSAVVFERRVDGRPLVFANTGLLRHYNTVIYDQATESWWQQYSGDGVVGQWAGKRLQPIASRIQSFAQFKRSHAKAGVLVPSDPKASDYGQTPFVRMDSRNDTAAQFPYAIPDGIGPLDRVVVIGDQAWSLARLRERTRIETDAVVLMWTPGMNSVHDTRWIPFGRDIGNVQAWMKTPSGTSDAVYDTTFAFAFAAFHPKGSWHLQ
ncbi:MAG: DUF3179 domain-containing protein [Rhodospirillales bacterium]|nr:DUF3179 domain-containing protein [Rhodospirillales bacterium]